MRIAQFVRQQNVKYFRFMPAKHVWMSLILLVEGLWPRIFSKTFVYGFKICTFYEKEMVPNFWSLIRDLWKWGCLFPLMYQIVDKNWVSWRLLRWHEIYYKCFFCLSFDENAKILLLLGQLYSLDDIFLQLQLYLRLKLVRKKFKKF